MTIQLEPPHHETVLDNTSRRVAKVYAEALLNAADQSGQADTVLDELRELIGEVFRREPQVETILGSAAVGRERKAALIRQTFEGRASDKLVDFLLILNEHDRLDLVRGVANAYRDLFDHRKDRIQAEVRSAVALTDDQRAQIGNQLRAAFGKEPILHERLDSELLGGLVVQVDDWVYDSSVRTRLEMIRKQLVERSSHEIQSGRDRFRSAN